MDLPVINEGRVKFTTGCSTTGVQRLAFSHPYTAQESLLNPLDVASLTIEQLDVVFPSNEHMEDALTRLETRFALFQTTLSALVSRARSYIDPVGFGSDINILSVSKNGQSTPEEDIWCIDFRGLLTLCLSKETYQDLGHPGTKLPFSKHLPDRYLLRFPLQENAGGANNRARRDAAIKAWDARRAAKWTVRGSIKDHSKAAEQLGTTESALRDVKCTKSVVHNVFIPHVSLLPRPAKADEDEWITELESLFEWTGMACLHSERLQINDHVDPYVSFYETPTPNSPGNITHLRWEGFLAPEFVQLVIDATLETLDLPGSPDLVSITAQAFTWSPVSYISPRTGPPQVTSLDTPIRYPSIDGEDTWSLIVTPPKNSEQNEKQQRWCLAESIGKWDARWG